MDGGDWLAAGGSVLGAIIGPLVAMFLSSGNNEGIAVVNSPGARVTSSRKIKIDKRQITKVTIKSDRAPAERPAPTSRRPSQTQASDDDIWMYIFGIIIITLFVVAGYLRYRHEIYGVVIALQLFAAITAFSTLITTRIRSVVFGPWITAQVLLNIAMTAIAILSVRWLADPPFGAPETFQQFLIDGPRLSIGALLGEYGFDAILFTAYQILGLAISLITVALVFLHSLKLFFTADVIVRQKINRSYAPGKIRQWFVTGMHGSIVWPFVFALIFTILSLILTSGLGYAFASSNINSDLFAPTSE